LITRAARDRWPAGSRTGAPPSGCERTLASKLSNITQPYNRGGVPRPRLAAVTYAATATLILLGLASSRSGSLTVSTPALYWALTLAASTVGGSAKVLAKEP
jgi:hypothetical protein